MKDRIFGVLQRVGRSFMLPIALLPAAGLLLGIGSSFTNPTTLETYHLTGIITEGGVLFTLLDIMSKTGSAVFDNLALLFAMGVAIGMAKQEKEVAALSGAIAYLIMNTAISAMITAGGGIAALPANSTTNVLGITTLQMGVFGGIIVGLGTAALHNRFYNIRLPQVLSFFGGTRFVPIICSVVFLGAGVVLFFVWPIIQRGISALGTLVLSSGYAGTWIYGIIERALIPFGLHHVFYMPFWQTELGGSMVVDGTVVTGAQNIFFAELASRSTEHFSVSATRFMSGKFPFMIFGLPAAAFAMYRAARPEKKKVVGSLLLSAGLTSAITGITEPLEFTFLFVAPLMYGVHCVLAGLSYMLMHILNVGVGMTFSGGAIDLVLFGVLQGNAKTDWIWIIIVGLVYAVLYYFVFCFMIKRLDLKTPGREADDEETRLYTRKDMQRKDDSVSALILRGLGGRSNIIDIDCCATRLRVTVKSHENVDDKLLKQSGAAGVIIRGNGVQAVYGPQVSVIKSELDEYMRASCDDHNDIPPAGTEKDELEKAAVTDRELRTTLLYAHMNGTVVPLEEVPDEAFSQKVLGEGVAIDPAEGKLFAPCSGTVTQVFGKGHAVTLETEDGAELLLHIGIDTVKLGEGYFTPRVSEGQTIDRGDILVTFDMQAIRRAGYSLVTPMIVCNTGDWSEVTVTGSGKVSAGSGIMRLVK